MWCFQGQNVRQHFQLLKRPTSLLAFWINNGFAFFGHSWLLASSTNLLLYCFWSFLAALRGDFLFAITSKTSGTLCVSNSIPMFFAAGKRFFLANGRATPPIPAANAPIYCLVVCCSWKNVVNKLVWRNNPPLWNFFIFHCQNNLSRAIKSNQIPCLTSKLDADCLYVLYQQFFELQIKNYLSKLCDDESSPFLTRFALSMTLRIGAFTSPVFWYSIKSVYTKFRLLPDIQSYG